MPRRQYQQSCICFTNDTIAMFLFVSVCKDSLRIPHSCRGRECVIPAVSRTFHFGAKGLNVNEYFENMYFKNKRINTVIVILLLDSIKASHLIAIDAYYDLRFSSHSTCISRMMCSDFYVVVLNGICSGRKQVWC